MRADVGQEHGSQLMNRLVSVVAFGTAFATFLVANLVAALPILLDQEFVPFDPSLQANIGVNNEIDHAQTFTVGLSGRLVSAEVQVTRYSYVTEPLLFDLRTVIGGNLPSEPDAGPNILASLSIEANAVPTYDDGNSPWPNFLTIDLSSFGVMVSPGQQLALTFRSDDPGGPNASKWGYTWRGMVGGNYNGGNAFPRGENGGWQDYLNGRYDLAFRTFVAVPEPATITVVASSALALLMTRRRNRPLPASA
jgi:hypothetical protein